MSIFIYIICSGYKMIPDGMTGAVRYLRSIWKNHTLFKMDRIKFRL